MHPDGQWVVVLNSGEGGPAETAGGGCVLFKCDPSTGALAFHSEFEFPHPTCVKFAPPPRGAAL